MRLDESFSVAYSINMPLNVNEPQTNAVVDEILRLMTSWTPRERIGMFRMWLRGSLSIVHLHVLTVLEAEGPLSMGKLAEALDVSVASATGIVDRMEQRGLVERRDDEADRRVVHVYPTDAGIGVFREVEEQRRVGLARVLGRMSGRDQKAFLIGLRGMRKAREALAAEADAADAAGATEGATRAASRAASTGAAR
jgi:DNA-binding MarR family transcriptional regulator